MKICLVIPGSSKTRIAVCQAVEKMGFVPEYSDGGLYLYTGESSGALDIVVLDWEQPEMQGAKLKKQLENLKKSRESLVLFCRDGVEKRHLTEILDVGRNREWALESFDMDGFMKSCSRAADGMKSNANPGIMECSAGQDDRQPGL